MVSRELLKFSDRQSLVEIKKGNSIEYCVCSYYDDNRPEGTKWDWGHYFMTMEDALKYIVLECFEVDAEYEEQKQKELKKLEDERNRFLTIAYNAICLGQVDEQFESEEDLYKDLGCTQEEYEEIMY